VFNAYLADTRSFPADRRSGFCAGWPALFVRSSQDLISFMEWLVRITRDIEFDSGHSCHHAIRPGCSIAYSVEEEDGTRNSWLSLAEIEGSLRTQTPTLMYEISISHKPARSHKGDQRHTHSSVKKSMGCKSHLRVLISGQCSRSNVQRKKIQRRACRAEFPGEDWSLALLKANSAPRSHRRSTSVQQARRSKRKFQR